MSATPGFRIAIVVPTYGRSEYLKRLIESVRISVPADGYEIIAVSSDPPGSEKVKELTLEPDVKVVLFGTRKPWQVRKNSLTSYMNEGVKASTCEWFVVVNDDMRFDEHWYTEFVKLVSEPKNRNAGMLVISTHIGHKKYGQRIPVVGRMKKDGQEWEDLPLSDFCIMKKDTWKEIGYFDEKINWCGYGVDNTLAVRFLTNKDIVAAETVRVDHFLAREERNTETIDEFTDFNYVRRKWDLWCRENGCAYECDFGGVKPYTFFNRFVNYLKRKRKILQRYRRYILK